MPERGIDDINFGWIASDLLNGRVVPFLGAAASAYPHDGRLTPPGGAALSWKLADDGPPTYPHLELARQHPALTHEAYKAWSAADTSCSNLARVASWYQLVAGDRARLRERLRDFLHLHLAEPNELHALLARAAKAKPMVIMTTNYDDLMERALAKAGVEHDLYIVAVDDVCGAARGSILLRRHGEAGFSPIGNASGSLALGGDGRGALTRTVVFKVHGHLDRDDSGNDTFVVTEEDYVFFLGRLSGDMSLLPADLVSVLSQRRWLFLGYGLKDWNLRVLFDRVSDIRPGAVNQGGAYRSSAIVRGYDDVDAKLWDERGVTVYATNLTDFVDRLTVLV